MSKPNPLAYSKLTEWLGDFFLFLKETEGWSLREIARRSDLASGYLPMILSGKLRLSRKAFDKIRVLFQLSEDEELAANDLYTISESEIESERLSAYKRFSIKSQSTNKNQNENEVFRFLSDELLVELREMTLLKDSKGDAAWFRSRLRKHYSLPTIKEALKKLEEMGYISREKNKWIPTQKSISCNDGIFSLSLGAFHKRMLNKAQEAIHELERNERHLEGYTFSLKDKDYEKAVKIMLNAVESLKALEAPKGEGDNIFHFEAALFPLTQESHQEVSEKSRKEGKVES